ncbi:phage antirepressor KilAC domain-containing protein [Enterococcus faecium]|uniref:phage antirepressor KilAC domain-containing protein n=1 Tax=Enterococcus faecium TaxID=1352 RepID=UPI0006BDBD23|nr:phage antirepressor [Enterococcus faecium]ALF50623.1 phage antirepressor [Enterococcus faecium]ALL10558.1 phage antirepressor [Enterococcus faecium]MDP4513014.1 phage antirepressor [Enterococcus faecium]MDP4541840.1 phage antirepressor [Enterococcus faecium]MDP4554423.1 phage antirepressor [Enterococcus faecium]
MTNLQIFAFEEKEEIRTLLINDEPYFVGKDVAEVLGYQNGSRDVNRHVDEEDKLTHQISASGQNRNMTIINESGLYSLILKSKLPSAKKFKRWVTSEVLPTIRKTGSYSNVPQSFAQALRLAADLEEKNQLLEQQIAEYEPKISYLDTILSSTDTVATSQIAADYGMSAIALNKLLNELGVQHKVSGQWILYRKHMNQGYTKSHTSEIPKADGGTKVVMNTKWTQKGRVFIYNLLIAEGYYPQMDLEEIG